MANTLTPIDVYQIVNEMAQQTLGATAIKAVDTTTFVTVGETMLRNGTENTLNALSTVLARTIFSTRPYRSKLDILRATAMRWGAQVRKITYLYKGAEASQDYNTQLSPNQLANGNSIDMYKINAPLAVQLNFYGTKKLQKHITRFRDQLSLAFRSEDEFIRFINGVMVEFNNEVEILNEQKTRATLLNFMAGMQDMGLTVIDLVETFNTQQGTVYSRAQIFAGHMTEFMQHIASQIKIYSSRLTDMSVTYHANLDGHDDIIRHTPKARQRMIMYEPIFIEAEARVYSTIFNPSYLNVGDYEGVNFWQNPQDPTAVNVTPNILDTTTGESKNGNPVTIPFVLGLLYDEEALGIWPQFDYSSTTPFNSAGGYYNMFLHWRFNSFNDFTENAILFVLGDGGAGTVDQTHVVIDNTDAPVIVSGPNSDQSLNAVIVNTAANRAQISGEVTISGRGTASSNPLYVSGVTTAAEEASVPDEEASVPDEEPAPAKTRSKK